MIHIGISVNIKALISNLKYLCQQKWAESLKGHLHILSDKSNSWPRARAFETILGEDKIYICWSWLTKN